MKCSQIVSVLGFSLPAALSGRPPHGLNIGFTRFTGDKCDPGLKIGHEEHISNNRCKNWSKSRKFTSFQYTAWELDPKKNHYAWMYDVPDCNVAVYSEKNCEGERFMMGNYPNTTGVCGKKFGFEGVSVGVACDKAHPYEGIRCETFCITSAYKKQLLWDPQAQVEAGKVKHDSHELAECCKDSDKQREAYHQLHDNVPVERRLRWQETGKQTLDERRKEYKEQTDKKAAESRARKEELQGMIDEAKKNVTQAELEFANRMTNGTANETLRNELLNRISTKKNVVTQLLMEQAGVPDNDSTNA